MTATLPARTLRVARTPEDADRLLVDGTALAGGTDLLVALRSAPVALDLVDLSQVPTPVLTPLPDGAIRLSATASLRDLDTALTHHSGIGSPALLAAIALFAGETIRSRATLGGNLATGSPGADTVPALVAADAVVELRGGDGRRECPVTAFLLGPRRVDLRPTEWIEAVRLPAPATAGTLAGGMRKVAGRRAQAISLVSLAWQWITDGGRRSEVRLAMGAVAPTVIRLTAAEALLDGPVDVEVEAAVAAALQAISPIDDLRASAAYRRACVAGLIRELLTDAAPPTPHDPTTPERNSTP